MEEMRDHDPIWAPDGRSLFYSSGRGGASNIWKVPIDEDTGEILGDPEPETFDEEVEPVS
jgi:Tol biopolymer transport system component